MKRSICCQKPCRLRDNRKDGIMMQLDRKRLTSFMAGAVLLLLLAATAFPQEDESMLTGCLVEGNTGFALKLYGELGNKESNVFFSPFSISSAMGMTYAGARQNTAKEMKEALCFHVNQKQLPLTFKLLNNELAANASGDGQKLNIANGLCLTGGGLSTDFKSLLTENFEAELFSGGLDKINGWVSKKTEGKIEKILESLDPNSVCVLLNAIYFKGTWESRFRTQDTQDAPFNVSSGKQVTAPLMYQKCYIKVLRHQGFRAATVPYKGNRLSMVILLPDSVDGLPGLEKQLTADNLKQWLGELDRAPEMETVLFLPKFRMKTEYDLVSAFKALGVKEAFNEGGTADFSGMGWKKGELWISQIKHKAFVEVNEEGTEAAAATAVEMATKSAPRYPVFRADHPFFFIIRDNQTGSILFLGRLSDPNQAQKGTSK